MDREGLDPQKLHGALPLMPWQAFADWIGMGEEPIVVRTWIERGYRIEERELSWLTDEQVLTLLEAIRQGCDNPHVEPIVLLCLATGAK